jgi:hypothetical protein
MWPANAFAEGGASIPSTSSDLAPPTWLTAGPFKDAKERAGARAGGSGLSEGRGAGGGGWGGGAGEGGANVSKDVMAQAGALHRATSREVYVLKSPLHGHFILFFCSSKCTRILTFENVLVKKKGLLLSTPCLSVERCGCEWATSCLLACPGMQRHRYRQRWR